MEFNSGFKGLNSEDTN